MEMGGFDAPAPVIEEAKPEKAKKKQMVGTRLHVSLSGYSLVSSASVASQK